MKKKDPRKKPRKSINNVPRTRVSSKQNANRLRLTNRVILPPTKIFLINPIDDQVVKELRYGWKRISYLSEAQKHLQILVEHRKSRNPIMNEQAILLSFTLGELLLKELSGLLGKSTLRCHDFEVLVRPGPVASVEIHARALEHVKPFIYRSPFQPHVSINGTGYPVAFNLRDDDHFIKRLEQRAIYDPENYLGKGQLFAFLYRWIHFETTVLPSGQNAVKLWNWCDPTISLARFWKQALGDDAKSTGNSGDLVQWFQTDSGIAHYLVGYAPIDDRELSNGTAVLKTLLLPGMENTPEERTMFRGRSSVDRGKISKLIGNATLRSLSESEDLSILFQLHSICPQVKLIPDLVFLYGIDRPDQSTPVLEI